MSDSAGFLGEGTSGAVAGFIRTAKCPQAMVTIGLTLEKGQEITAIREVSLRHLQVGERQPDLKG